MAELCDLYFADAKAGRLSTRRVQKKSSTLAVDLGRIERHIKPLLGRRAVTAVTRETSRRSCTMSRPARPLARKRRKKRGLARVSGGNGAAVAPWGCSGAIFTYAVRSRMRSDNPVHGVMRPADNKRDRRLSDDEYRALGCALSKAAKDKMWPPATAATRFLALTGWRSGEALSLHWDEIDFPRRTVKLRDSKSGESVRPLSHAACDVLRSLMRSGSLVFPATRGSGDVILSGYKKRCSRKSPNSATSPLR